jgi:hypothetical protein
MSINFNPSFVRQLASNPDTAPGGGGGPLESVATFAELPSAATTPADTGYWVAEHSLTYWPHAQVSTFQVNRWLPERWVKIVYNSTHPFIINREAGDTVSAIESRGWSKTITGGGEGSDITETAGAIRLISQGGSFYNSVLNISNGIIPSGADILIYAEVDQVDLNGTNGYGGLLRIRGENRIAGVCWCQNNTLNKVGFYDTTFASAVNKGIGSRNITGFDPVIVKATGMGATAPTITDHMSSKFGRPHPDQFTLGLDQRTAAGNVGLTMNCNNVPGNNSILDIKMLVMFEILEAAP